jgi:hypothetical protein
MMIGFEKSTSSSCWSWIPASPLLDTPNIPPPHHLPHRPLDQQLSNKHRRFRSHFLWRLRLYPGVIAGPLPSCLFTLASAISAPFGFETTGVSTFTSYILPLMIGLYDLT